MFWTNFVEEIKTRIVCSVICNFFQNSCCLWDNVERCGRARHTLI